ncbi:family 43 glycosylhydrolase [Sphingomonas sp. SM33]|uniref:Family 43 glycosylhydrolase n=1 Tax=Sphingomonas telluris TaxID=2907998 RepID=A0ABS9VMD6_9SPHN|nr:family 43 glycosylhydrolase [Sphingomonas telluris]MCH8616123.1 family 43 glycosylhydrolase [Sphingomonas telluris]
MRKIGLLLACGAALLAGTPAHAQKRTYINPIDLDYRYNWEQTNNGVSYRTGADPAIVRHKGAYYLFQTLADGYWRSTNLIDWNFITPSRWPFGGIVAPAVASDGDRLIIWPSMSFTRPGSILVTTAPETGKLDFLVRTMPDLPHAVDDRYLEKMKPGDIPPGPWDPGLLKDDDGRWYLYWNSSNVFPIYGIEIEFKDGTVVYKGEAKPLFTLHPEQHGWERFGQDHSGLLANGQPTKPYVEGAWVTKHDGKYYLQYGAPGTEFNAYANGTYVSDKPLGPFKYAEYNPIAYKPGGFVQGAGHGSTFEDAYGNYWNTGTPWIGYNWTFERRINMFPAKFEADGQFHASSRFQDFPQYMPKKKVDDIDSLFTGWMLLSYRKAASASSTMGEFAADRVTDENPRTFWVAAANKPGETLTLDLGAVKAVHAVQVNYADYKSGRFADAPDIYTEFELQHSVDGKTWQPLAKPDGSRRDRANAYLELPQPVRTRYVRYVHGHVGGANLAISDLRVFGNAEGRVPVQPSGVVGQRHQDQRDATIRWAKVPSAVGYNIRFGIRPDRLTLTHQLFSDELGNGATLTKELRSLNVGVPYYVAIEAFNETGVSKLSRVVKMR